MIFRAVWGVVFALGMASLSLPAHAQITRYEFQASGDFTVVNNAAATPCDVAPCVTYANPGRITGVVTLSQPIPASYNSNLRNLGIVDFSFNDTVGEISRSDPNVRLIASSARTNAAGEILNFRLVIDRWNQTAFTVGDGTDNSRYGSITLSESQMSSLRNRDCDSAGSGIDGLHCAGGAPSQDSVNAANFAMTNRLVNTTPQPVPTMTEWAMILLSLALAGGAALVIHRRQSA